MELVLLFSIAMLSLVAIYGLLVRNLEGTKGLTKPYRTKNGKTRTARKSRETHLVWEN